MQLSDLKNPVKFIKENPIPVGIFLVAFLVRFIYIFELNFAPFTDCLTLKTLFYSDWADLFLIRLVQILIGSVSCFLIYSITRTILESRYWGLAAGFIAAIYGPFIFFDAMVAKPFLAVFLVLLMIYFLLRLEQRSPWYAFFAAVVLALAIFAQENFIVIIPVILLWIFKKKDIEGKAKKIVLYILGIAVVILPVILMNYSATGDLLPTSLRGSEIFHIGSNDAPNDTHNSPEIEGAKPASYTDIQARKFMLFWNFFENPDNRNYYFHKTHSRILGAPVLGFGFIAPFGFLGLCLSIRRFKKYGLLFIVFLTYMTSMVLVDNSANFRLPVVPILIIFAVFSIYWSVEKARQKKYVYIGIALYVLVVSLIISGHNMYPEETANIEITLECDG